MTLRCVDTSAWHRAPHPLVEPLWSAALARDEIGLCDQVRLEILYSARSAADYERLGMRLCGLQSVPMGPGAYARALEVQRALSRVGGLHHRSVKIADLLIAAAAEAAGATVWHYDADFNRIAAVTGQSTEWIVPQGSL